MTTKPSHDRVNILGVGVSAINMQMAVDQTAYWIENRIKDYVVIACVHDIMQSQNNPQFRDTVNNAGMVTPDGMPLVFLSRWLGYPHVDRVYGPDFMLATSAMMAERGFTSFYYGGAEGIPELLTEKMTERFPGLKVAGAYSPPFRPLTPEEDEEVIEMINAANPDVVWVGLGCPKQNYWMVEHRARINAPVFVGIGAAFNFHTGKVPQAPHWMQRNALEWLYRLMAEPRRLWRRYLIYNPLFVMNVVLQLTGLRRFPLETGEATQST